MRWIALAMLLPACSDDTGSANCENGCAYPLQIQIRAAARPLPDGLYELVVRVSGSAQDRAACRMDAGTLSCTSSVGINVGSLRDDGKTVTGLVVELRGTPAQVALSLSHDGAITLNSEVFPEYFDATPMSTSCTRTCRTALVSLSI